jgi:hypothetical protein
MSLCTVAASSVAREQAPHPASLRAEAHHATTRPVRNSSAEDLSRETDHFELLVVPPYLDVVVFDIVRSSPAATVEIFPPGAVRPLQAGSGGVESMGVGKVLSTLVVHHPVPGSWIVRKSSADERVRILSQHFFPKGVLVRPAFSDGLRQYDRVRVVYSVTDAHGRSIEEQPDHKLALEMALTRPDGTIEALPMERRPELAGTVFSAVHDSDCAIAGRYWTTAGVTSIDAEGNRVAIFRDRWSGFSVTAATRVDCSVTATEQQWIPGVAARVECVDRNRQPIEMSVFSTGSPSRLFRPLLQYEDAQADAALDLQYLGAGAFRGLLRGAERSGIYRLQLTVDRSRVRPPYNVRFVPGEVTFARRSTVLRSWLTLLSASILLGLTAIVVKGRQHRLRDRVFRR